MTNRITRHLYHALLTLGLTLTLGGCASTRLALPPGDPKLSYPGETHLKNLRQLTKGGTNAEAYWSFDGTHLVFQRKGPPSQRACDQIYTMRADALLSQKTAPTFISKDNGRTTCAYYLPGDKRVLYASTLTEGPECPTEPDKSQGYVWPIYDSYQIYSSDLEGNDVRPLEPGAPNAYNAEATVCKDGSVVFTSDRDGDLDLYTAKLDPKFSTLTNIKRITFEIGYDGGAFFSSDCKKIVWRASRPRPGKERDDYLTLLKQHLVRPGALEIWMANADGSHARQVSRMGSASFAPFFTPDGKRILFASNPRDPKGRRFDIYRINTNGTGLERITYSNTFDSFPMFSPNGRYLAFSSNRHADHPHETNVFIADWVEPPAPVLSIDDPDPANRFYATVKTLSSPALTGRTEDWVANQFSRLGLKAFPLKVDHTILATWGKACGKTQPIVMSARLDPSGFDHASGVAGLLEVARMISSQTDKACFIFAAWMGDGGSSRFVETLKDAKIRPKAMLNMDRIDRMEANNLFISGIESARKWPTVLQPLCEARMLKCLEDGDGYATGVPALHFSTGRHQDSCRVPDTHEEINATGGIQAADVVAATALAIASMHFPVAF